MKPARTGAQCAPLMQSGLGSVAVLHAMRRLALEIDGVMPGEERIEPVFTELVASHTRRMDALGLTA